MIHRRVELHRRLQRVAPIPRRQLVRGTARERVLNRVDVEAADAEPGPVATGFHGRVAAHEDVGALEDTGLPHDVLRRWIDLFGGRTVHDHTPRYAGLSHVFDERAGGSEHDGTLRVVLIAMEIALRAAQRVVLGDQAEGGTGGAGW